MFCGFCDNDDDADPLTLPATSTSICRSYLVRPDGMGGMSGQFGWYEWLVTRSGILFLIAREYSAQCIECFRHRDWGSSSTFPVCFVGVVLLALGPMGPVMSATFCV